MSDTESFVYRYSWDKDDLQNYPWTHHYVKQPQVLAYLKHVVERHDLRKHMQFNTEMVSANWDDDSSVWTISLSTGETLHVRYLVTALGLLSKANYPDIPGIDSFKGIKAHTAKWPRDLDVTGKRVGIIGCGSTGVQVITDIGSKVKTLTCFQRHPQYSVPSGDRPVDPSYREYVNKNYDAIFDQVKSSAVGFGFAESSRSYAEVPESEREAVFEDLWRKGNGFRFMFGGFNDVATNKEANEAACEFIRKKIREIVKDPEKARKLQPHDYYARRPLCDGGYFNQFNRKDVDIVLLQETPIMSITPTGVQATDKHYDLDVLIFATGFDAVEGNYTRLRMHGRNGLSLKNYWDTTGPTSFLGVSVPAFPNLLMITGPQGPFTNLPPAIEAHVELISNLIAHAEDVRRSTGDDHAVIEATKEAEQKWCQECERVAEGSLFKETASWIFGQNVPGKRVALRFYFGGLKGFYEAVGRVIQNGYEGFVPIGMDKKGVGEGRVEARL
jgi:cyclohexanone monooxygenase